MSLFPADSGEARPTRLPVSIEDIDVLLTAQILVAWAGEGGEEPRLAWWRSDLASEFGGEDLFKRLLPHTFDWAVLQGAREAARRMDAELRGQADDADQIRSLYHLGFELDERADERLQDLKRGGTTPVETLPRLEPFLNNSWDLDRFRAWVAEHGEPEHAPAPIGRRLKGAPPGALPELVRRLVAGLSPLHGAYPLPHYRVLP